MNAHLSFSSQIILFVVTEVKPLNCKLSSQIKGSMNVLPILFQKLAQSYSVSFEMKRLFFSFRIFYY